jgi:hypothetical protein
MKNTDLRAKARAIFGSAVAEPMPNQPNGAKALQQRANARPIPTYKVGGAVKKMPTPGDSVASGNRMSKMEADESRFMDMLDKKKAMPSARNAVDSGNRMSKMEGAEMRKMKMAKGGKVQTASDTARKLATEMGGMRKGGKVKPVSVDMEGLEAMTRSMRPTVKDDLEMKVMQARNSVTQKREMEDAAPKKQSFNEAFGAARKRGDKTFSWNGGSYGTQLKGETPKAARPTAPAARPAAPAPRAAAPEILAPAPRAPAAAPAPRATAPAPTARATAPATRGKVGFANVAPALAGAKSAIDRGLSGIGAFFEAANAGAGGAERARRANIAAAAAKRAKAKEDYDPYSAASNLKLALGGFAKGGKVKGDKPKNGLAVMIAIGKVKPVKKMNGGSMAARETDTESSKLTRQMAGGGDPMGYMAGGAPMGYAAGGAGKTRKGQAPIKKAQGGAAKVRKGMMTPEGNITHAMNKIRGE